MSRKTIILGITHFNLLSFSFLSEKLIIKELDLTLKVGMLLPLVLSLAFYHKLKEIVEDKGPLNWALKLEGWNSSVHF